MDSYEFVYDTDDCSNIHETVEVKNWLELQDIIKKYRKNGCYNIDATYIEKGDKETEEKADMDYTFDDDGNITITEKNVTLTISYEEILKIYWQYQKEHFHKEDVRNRIEEMIEEGLLPEKAYDNKEYIDALTDYYSSAMEYNKDLSEDEIRGWNTLLDDAFEEIKYKDYEKERTVPEKE